jgi:glycosyltransferase involved in cell wall biosynthesis
MHIMDYKNGLTADSRSAAQPKVSIVMPVYNEEQLLPSVIPELNRIFKTLDFTCELILCENGSTDSTKIKAQELTRSYEQTSLLTLDKADYGAAIKTGILASEAPFVFVFDIDYYDIDFLKQAISSLERYDIVIASKLAPGANDKRNALRRMITRGFSLVIKILFKTTVSETHGMKAFRRDSIEPVLVKTASSKDLFDTELIIRAERSGLKIAEIPVTVEEKRPTRSSILSRIPRTVAGLLVIRYKLWREGSE